MLSWFTVLCSLAVILRPAHCVSAANLLPYGTEHANSSMIHGTDSTGVDVTLPESFTFLGETFSTVHVNGNGALQWGSPVLEVDEPNSKLIAPYFADTDRSSSGEVYYRSTNDPVVVQQVTDIIAANFAGLSTEELAINYLFIATWHHIPALGGPTTQHNTFQCVLAYSAEITVDGSQTQPPVSYVMFLYEDGGMQWSGGEGGNGEHALVEIRNGNDKNLILPTSRTSAVLEIATSGNTGVSGQWLFRVDGEQVILPVPLVGLEYVQYPPILESVGSQTICIVRLSPGEPSQDFSLTLTVNEGEEEIDVNFTASGSSRQCVVLTIQDDNDIEYDETMTVGLSSTSSITILPSNTIIPILDDDIAVGWESVSHDVSENIGSVQLCAILEASQLSEEVIVAVRARVGLEDTVRNTDYILANTQLDFQVSGSRRLCVSAGIINDGTVENNETLTVELQTMDSRVTITSPTTVITIHDDNDVMYITPLASGLDIRESSTDSLVCVLISGASERHFELGMTLNEGTALVGEHYEDTSKVATIRPMSASYCFSLLIINNDIYDINGRDFTATIYTSDSAVVIQDDIISLHIIDNDAGKVSITFSQNEFTGSEEEGKVDVCVWLESGKLGPGSQIDVNLTTHTDIRPAYRTAAFKNQDYSDAERIVRFDSSTVPMTDPQCVSVPVIDDDVLEDRETFIMELVKVDSSQDYKLEPFTVIAEIIDNEIITATVENTRLMVLESEYSHAETCVIINGDREIDIEITATPTSMNATAGVDYETTPIKFTFEKDDTRGCASVRVHNDYIIEALYEIFYIDFSSSDEHVVFNESRVEVTIKDTDVLTYTILESPHLTNASEPQLCIPTALFCITTYGRMAIALEISYRTLDNTAVAGEDYVAFNITKTLGPRSKKDSSDCFHYCTMDDIIVEGTESFFIAVVPLTDRIIPDGGKDRLRIDINDNDVVHVVPYETAVSVNEGDRYATVCASLTGLTERPVDITITTVDDTAIKDEDYVIENDTIHFQSYLSIYGHLTAEQVIQFSDSPPVTTECVNITIIDDLVLEEVSSKTFTVHFSSTSLKQNLLKIESGIVVTIHDDDNVTISLTEDSAVVREEDQRVRIQLSLIGVADFPITASIRTNTIPGIAAANPHDDYTTVEDSVVLPARYMDGELLPNELIVPIRDDNLLEDMEAFNVILSVQSSNPRVFVGEPNIQTIWIEDNDFVQLGLSDAEFRVLERNEYAPVCCELFGATGKTVLVNITSNPGTAKDGVDYVASPDPSQFVFLPSSDIYQKVCVNYQLLDDDSLESVESFTVTISTSVPRVIVGHNVSTVSLVDDDGVYVTLVDGELSVDENGEEGEGGEVTMCVKMTGIIEREIEINLFTEEGTATADEDFIPRSPMLVFLPSDSGNQTSCATFQYRNDDIVEETEVFFVNLTATGITHGNISILTNRAKIQILDSDQVSVDFVHSLYSVTEGEHENIEVCAELESLVEKEIVVQFSAAADTAQHYSDFQQTESQLIFEARGDTRACTPIIIMDDDLLENEEDFIVYILLSDPALYVRNDATSSNTSAVVSIGDNDHVSVSLVSSLYEVSEDVSLVSVCSNLTGMTGKEIVLSFTSQRGTAQDEIDYSAPPSSIVFAPSSAPHQTECVDVYIINDVILEDVETFHLEITTTVPRVSITQSTATVRVYDEDSVEVSLVEDVIRVPEEMEGGEVDVCVIRTGVIEKAVVVQLSTQPQTALAGMDFSASRHAVQFPPSPTNNQTVCFSFSILNDDVVEENETFLIQLTASESYIDINDNETTVIILDTDTVAVVFERVEYAVNEEEEVLSVCIELEAAVEKQVSVGLSTDDATAVSGADFTQTDIELVFEPLNATILCTPIHIENDDIVEEQEHFFLTLSTIDTALYTYDSQGNISNTSMAVVTVADNDAVTVSLVRSEVNVEEEDAEAEVCVRLSGVIERDILVTLTTVSDTAEADSDYLTTVSTVTFRPGISSFQINCTTFFLINDDTVEDRENFFVELSTNDHQVDLGRVRTKIVVDDADLVLVDFVELNQTVSERDAMVMVCVELYAPVEAVVTVQLATDDHTALHSVDFSDTYVELVFEAYGNISECVEIPIIDNDILEYDEEFLVYIFDSDRARVVEHDDGRGYVEIEVGSGGEIEVLSGGVQSVVSIIDDDYVHIGIEEPTYTVGESDDDVIVCLVVVGEMERTVDVTLKTIERRGTAKDGIDYYGASKDVTFGPESVREGECVVVQIIKDEIVENDETFIIGLSSSLEGSAVILEPIKVASITILDDDVVCPYDSTKSPRGNYDWPEIRPGLVELPCQHLKEGTDPEERSVAQRLCDNNGIWGEVNLEGCYGDTDDIFPHLDKLPYSCEIFRELLLVVIQATEEGKFKTMYVDIVARYFRDFAEITEEDGYIIEDHMCLDDVDSFTVAVNIIDQLIVWPRDVLRDNSTLIIRSFETISEHLVANPQSPDKNIALKNMAFSSSIDEKVNLEKDGIVRLFSSSKKVPLRISDELSESSDTETVLGAIYLPSSLFSSLEDKDVTEFGTWFSLHKMGSLFPLPLTASANDSVSTPIISATLGGHVITNLLEPVTFSLRLLNQSVTATNCAAWDHESEEWNTLGCKTVSVIAGYVTCECDHLTNFAGVGAALLPEPTRYEPPKNLAMSIISLVGTMLALLALTLTLFTLIAFSKLRRRRTTILRAQLCSSLVFLLLGYVGHIIMEYTSTYPQDSPSSCATVSVVTHYFTLTTLVWIGSEALLMFRKLIFGEKLGELSNLYFVTASATSWVLPFPFAAIPAALNRDWVITEDEYCFISSLPVFLATFIFPVVVTLVFNVVIYLVVMTVFFKFLCKKQPPLTEQVNKKKKMKKSRRQAISQLIYSTPIIAVLFIFSWIFAALTFVTSEASLGFHLLSAFFTATLGWFIFIYYIATAKDTRKLVYDAFCGKPKKNLNVNQFLSMESLGKASGIDESDSDSDYPERERRYGEFDVTYVGRKGALIEQKFSVRFMGGEGEEGVVREEGEDEKAIGDDSGNREPNGLETAGGSSHGLSGQIVFSAITPSSPQKDDEKATFSSSSLQPSQHTETERTDSSGLTTILEDKKQQNENTGNDDSTPVQMSSHSNSQEDVNSDDGSPKAAEMRKTFLPPSGQVIFTVTPET